LGQQIQEKDKDVVSLKEYMLKVEKEEILKQ
jgi:hypothetical protein